MIVRKLTATMLAGMVPCLSYAQSSVTLYGVVDIFVAHFHQGSQNVTSMNSGGGMGSRWGVRGAEDLGGGYQAFFALENGFNANNGTLAQGGREFGRQAYVGIRKEEYGSLRFGRLETPGYVWALKYDAIGLPTVGVLGTLGGTDPRPWAYNPFTDPSRVDNGILYLSPKWHGFSIALLHSLSGNAGQPINKSYDVDSITYENDTLSASYGFAHGTGTTNSTAATKSDVEHNFGVKYKTPWFSVFGTYQLRKPSDSPTDRLWQTGVQIPIGVFDTLRVAYGSLNNGVTNGTNAQTTNTDAKTWAVAEVHVLSKMTLVYAFFQRLYDSGNSRMALYPPGGISSTNVINANETAWGIGLQHRF
ncbi:porin [Burkholderia cenocepacia]|uniref:porin n=1 Tax=Burkholderia cenocepacia TaxID=95486 RepID=UPI000F57AB8A|nr:porin [Burkholderia cenocepacia]RQU32818.1 porin [Burkholderia cenocepacia]RQU55191.1 porin [Burkholderia cenocepacia]